MTRPTAVQGAPRRIEPGLGAGSTPPVVATRTPQAVSTPPVVATRTPQAVSTLPVDRVTRLLAQATGASMAAYCLFDEGVAICLSAFGASPRDLEALAPLWQRTSVHDHMVVIEDSRTDAYLSSKRVTDADLPVRFFAGMPVRNEEGRTVGCVSVLDTRTRRVRNEDLTALEDARGLLELELALRRQAEFDCLTGLPNRRSLDDQLAREWRRAAREGTSISMLAIDIDQFETYNDQHGHTAGDFALCQIGKAMREALHRPADVLARSGGEEFRACLPQTDAAGASKIAEAVRVAVEALALPCVDRTPPVVTISVGIATIANAVEQPFARARLVAAAEGALRVAKSMGGNRAMASESFAEQQRTPPA